MNRSTLILLGAVAAIILIIIFSLPKEQASETYISQIEKERQEKEEFMKSGEESPFLSDTIAFTGLKYYPIDKKYRIAAKLESIESKKVVILGTSDGLQQKYLEYAYAKFTIDNTECKLLILEVMDMGPQRGKLFLAFADATSGNETYGAGRYLDLKKIRGASTIELDFNMAYNPYCAYSDHFSCPLPPRENILNVQIKAGELSYHK